MTFFSAFCADYPDACAAAEEEPVADQGADVGGSGDVQDRQQGDQAGEGAHSRLHGRVKVSPVVYYASDVTDLVSRDNPCPHLGNIVTIKLSENQENVPQTDNTYLTMIVETHFQVCLCISIRIANHIDNN